MPSKISTRKRKAVLQPEPVIEQASVPEIPEIVDSVLEEFAAEFKDENASDEEVLDEEVSQNEEDADDNVQITFEDDEQGEGDAESSQGEQSSDEEERDDFKQNAMEIKLDAATETLIKKKVKAAPKSGRTGVVFLGRIPHGFYEAQMQSYFRQFGAVNKLRLSRNKKTGASKHYAYIEFKHEEVAKIVAETMNGYLLYSHIMKCSFIEHEKVHADLFVGANKKFKVIPWNKVEKIRHNKPKTEEQVKKITGKLTLREKKKRQKLNEKLSAAGVKYDFPGYEGAAKESPKCQVDAPERSSAFFKTI